MMSHLQVMGGSHAIPERPGFEEAMSAHRSYVSPFRPAIAPKIAELWRKDADYHGPGSLELETVPSAPPLVAEAWW